MSFRQTVGVVLLVGLLGVLAPATAQAGIFDSPELGPDRVEPGFLARVLAWVQAVVAQLPEVFAPQEGAAILPGG